MPTRAPVLVLNPLVDESFAAEAERLATTNAVEAKDLETALRKHYPETVVHERGLSGEPRLVWYVYREGHWVPPYAITGASNSR